MQARATVLDAMLTPPPSTTNYQTEVLAEEQRDGYRARKIRFNLSEYKFYDNDTIVMQHYVYELGDGKISPN